MPRERTSGADQARLATVWVGRAAVRWSDSTGGRAPSGAPSSKPLLLVSGLGGNIGMWAPLRAALAGRRTIAFDAPGTGASPAVAGKLDMPHLARIASRVLDAAGIEEADVLGYSFGGFVAQELARREPRVRRLVLAATSAGVASSPADLWELVGPAALRTPLAVGVMLTPSRYHLSPSGQRLVRIAFGDPNTHSYEVADRARSASPPSGLGYLQQLAAGHGWSSPEWLHELRVPTLVLSARRDSVSTVAAGRYLAETIPGARQVVVPAAGHSFLLRDDQSEAASVLEAFLDGPDQGMRPRRRG